MNTREIDRLEKAEKRKLYRFAFLLRTVIGLSVWFLIAYARVPLLEDALHYEFVGSQVAADWLAGRESIWLTSAIAGGRQAWLIVAIIAGFYYILGGIRALPLLIIAYAAVTAYTPVMTFRITRKLGGSIDAARFAGRLVAFTPCIAFWAGALYKEGLILLLLNVAVYGALLLQERFGWKALLTVVIGIAGIYGARFYLAVLVAVSIAIPVLIGRPKKKGVGARTAMLLKQTAIAAVLAVVLLQTGIFRSVRRVIPESPEEMLERIDDSRLDLAHANSGYLSSTRVGTLGGAVAFLPVGMAYFLAVPLPWHIGSARQNLTIPETFLWLLMYPMMFIGAVRSYRRNREGTLLILILTLTMTMFYGIFVGNIGTAYRMRSQVWLFWAIFAGIGWEARKAKKRERGLREEENTPGAVPTPPRQLPDDALPEESLTW